MEKFEYKIAIGDYTLDDERMLNNYGLEGWELTSLIYPVKPKNQGIGAKAALYYLKRKLYN